MSFHLLTSIALATSVRALVQVDDDVVLVDAVVVHEDPRRPASGPDLGPIIQVEGTSVRVPVPDPRHRSVVGEHDAVLLDRAYALVWVPWPDDAQALLLGDQRLVPRSPPPAALIQESGPADERLDMVFLGDGYTESELDVFAQDVDRITAHMLSIEPYGSYREVFNIWRIDRASAESGVSHFEGSSNVERDTAYGCFYGCGGISRLICCDDSAVLSAVQDEVPGADGVLVLVNDPTYGGSGGFEYATSYTADPTGSEVAVHELGHSLVGLWDEYSYGQAWSGGPQAPNCTKDPDDPHWVEWLDQVDAYTPCSYTNYARPTQSDCMMNTLQDDYCPVCREQAVLAMYGALPSLVVDSWGGEGTYGVELVHSGLEVTWTVDGVEVGQGSEITLSDCTPESTLIASVQDPTEWVRADPDGLLSDEVEWSVDCPTTRPPPDPQPDCGCSTTRPLHGIALVLGLAALVRRRLH